MIRTASLIALPFLLLACSSEPTEEVTTVDLEGGEAPNTNPLVERFDDVVIVVNADGLGVHQQAPLRFGSPRSEVDGAVEAAFGSAGITSRNEECGAGEMEFSEFGPLSIAYQDGKFAGWFLREGGQVVTSDGIRPGVSTMDGLKSERQVREIDSTLPGEFEYTTADFGTIRGFSENDRITGLQAGLSCFFR